MSIELNYYIYALQNTILIGLGRMTKSICMASYNGSPFIAKQIASILPQLQDGDELIVVDDSSKDDTLQIVRSFDDPRIKLHSNSANQRHVKTFSRAMSLAGNELIFLCDQDDIWEMDRLDIFEEKFLEFPEVQLITSNFYCIDDNDQPVEHKLNKVSASTSFNYKSNIIRILRGDIGYYGCAMAFRKDLLPVILPVPDYVEAHDLWIAMAANLLRSNLHIEEKTLAHRIHHSNTSNLNRSLIKKLDARIGFIKQYRDLSKRQKFFH